MNVGFIGLGIMGTPMSKNIKLKKQNVNLRVFDKSSAANTELETLGVTIATSAKEVVRESEVIFTMVPTGKDVSSLYDDLISEVNSGKTLVDMSTIEPDISIAIAEEVAKAGGIMLDAPVVKSKAAAIEGSLGIYVGGNEAAYQRVKSLLECMGSNILYLGQNGAGLVMKICHNMLVGQIQNGVNEMILLAQNFDIPVSTFKDAINAGGGSNFYLSGKASNIESEDFPVAFSIRNMNKDVHIAQDMVNTLGLTMPGVDNVVRIYEKAMAKGLADQDFSASYLAVKE